MLTEGELDADRVEGFLKFAIDGSFMFCWFPSTVILRATDLVPLFGLYLERDEQDEPLQGTYST